MASPETCWGQVPRGMDPPWTRLQSTRRCRPSYADIIKSTRRISVRKRTSPSPAHADDTCRDYFRRRFARVSTRMRGARAVAISLTSGSDRRDTASAMYRAYCCWRAAIDCFFSFTARSRPIANKQPSTN